MVKKNPGVKIRKAVIPVAGYGTRFLPATIAQPKEMLTVVDKPVIQYIVEEMVTAGIKEIVFVTGRGKRAIEDHFDYSAELEQSLRENGKLDLLEEVHRISQLARFVYVRQNKMLGNGHALLMAKEVIGNEPFAFSYGDDIIEHRTPAIAQLLPTYERHGSTVIGTMPIDPKLAHRYGILKPRGAVADQAFTVESVVEKPINYRGATAYFSPGRYIFTPDIFSYLERTPPSPSGEIFIADAVNAMAADRPVYARILEGRYFDCGNKLEYVKANIHFSLHHPDLTQDVLTYLKQTI